MFGRLQEFITRFERRRPTTQPLMLRGRVLPTPGRPTTTIEIFMTSDLDWSPAPTAAFANGAVRVVEGGTTRPGEIPAGSLVRVELSAGADQVERSGQIEIQSGKTMLAVRLDEAD